MYIETKKLTKRYDDRTVVKGVNLHVEKGTIYGLIGQNGAGKTTLLKMITNLTTPTSGEVLNTESLKRVGVLIEDPGFYPERTCFDNLKIKMLMFGTYSEEDCKHIMKIVKLSESENLQASKLSKGMQQRLGLAMALASGSDLLILDEPINGLDPEGIIEMRHILLALKKKGMTILVTSHILSELEKIADTFGIMKDGRLLSEISKSHLRVPLEKYYNQTVGGLK